MNILHITPFFSPNIGGVETHLLDLIAKLDELDYKNTILTYCPITTQIDHWKSKEAFGKYSHIYRFWWIGYNLFHRLEKHPLLNLIYITPYLFLRSVIWLVLCKQKFSTIHSHGINGAMIGIVLQKIFKIPRHIVSIYSTYDNVPMNNISGKILITVLNHTDIVLTQSKKSINQLKLLGVRADKIDQYRHWIDLNQFKPLDKVKLRNKYQIEDKFSVLFIGRMIPQKGALILAEVAKKLSKINFLFVGEGPDFEKIKLIARSHDNIKLFGNVPYSNLHFYYNLADIFCMPSLYDEGWGRVVMEALACGLPVIASNRGAISEVVDESVALVISPTVEQIKKSINQLVEDKFFYLKLKANSNQFARQNFSSKSISLITKHYV